jgi:hypothetical protein
VHGRGHARGRLARTKAVDRGGAGRCGEGRFLGPEEPPLGRGVESPEGPGVFRIEGAGVAACCENDLPTQPVPGQRQGCPLTFTPISTVADLHGFEPQKVGNEGSVSVLARRISSVARRTDSRSHSRHVRCSTMCSTSMSAARTDLACVRTAGPVSICAPVCARKTNSKDVNRGLARMMRVPHMRRSSSPEDRTTHSASVHRWPSGQMNRVNVSLVVRSTR